MTRTLTTGLSMIETVMERTLQVNRSTGVCGDKLLVEGIITMKPKSLVQTHPGASVAIDCNSINQKGGFMKKTKGEQIFYLVNDSKGMGSRLITEGYFSKLVKSLIKKNGLPEGSIRVEVSPAGINRIVFIIECDTEKIFRIIRDEYIEAVTRGFKVTELQILKEL